MKKKIDDKQVHPGDSGLCSEGFCKKWQLNVERSLNDENSTDAKNNIT